ncbi:hypothetical protein FA95DRAFT_1676378, partial [Auriscalpium vulgare]
MALTFIGKPISLISHSDVRYRGILAGIDPAASTIQLSNVFSMGTESRRPPEEFIPPVQEPYQYIIFRASEVKDLAVEEQTPAPRRNVHDDPAVLGASAPASSNGYPGYGAAPGYQPGAAPGQMPQPAPQQPQPQSYAQRPPQAQPGDASAAGSRAPASNPSDGRRSGAGSVHTAAASLETVERALGDLRTANARGGGGGGGRRNGRDVKAGDLRVPTTDFDFAGSNARFDKAALASGSKSPNTRSPGEEVAAEEENADGAEEEEEKAYNPQKSFFDSLSSSTQGNG